MTWSRNITKQSLRKISVAYHGAVKRTCGLNRWDGDHVACKSIGLDTFEETVLPNNFFLYHRSDRDENLWTYVKSERNRGNCRVLFPFFFIGN